MRRILGRAAHRLRPALAIAIAGWVLGASPPVASASTYEVTTGLDTNPPGQCTSEDCSLREAILRANGHDGPDTVVLEAGSEYHLEIAGGGEDDGLTGDFDSTGRLTVVASGPGKATVNGHDLDRVFDAFKRAAFVKIDVTGGYAQGTDGYGGGVSSSGPLTLERSRVAANRSVFNGGGIEVQGGDSRFRLIRSRVVGNSTTSNLSGAGGLIANGEALIAHSRVAGNETRSCGGAWFPNSAPTIKDSVFHDNEAALGGGALCATLGTLAISDSRFTENRALDGTGGALALTQLTGSIARTTFDMNQAADGGGAISVTGFDELRILRSTISRNEATSGVSGQGGGVLVGAGPVRFANSTIARNEAAASGGGIFVRENKLYGPGEAQLAFSTVAFNDGDSDSAGGDIGGGIMEGAGGDFEDVHGTLIALNEANTQPDCAASVTSTGHNLLTFVDAGCTGFDSPTDLTVADPDLGDLGTHGGPTETVNLQPASEAIDAGGRKGPPTDQRGVTRPQGPRYDIGAFERRP